MRISFGTEGWRAVIGDFFTFENVKKFAKAIANWLYWPERAKLDIYSEECTKEKAFKYAPPSSGVAIGYDTRFLSNNFAEVVAEVISDCGIPVFLSSSFCSSPAVSNYVLKNNLSAGLIITASHNTYEYNGIKFKGEYGGSAISEIKWGIEKMLFSQKDFIPNNTQKAHIKKVCFDDVYTEETVSYVDMERIANARFKIISDSIYGSASGLLRKFFHSVGVFIDEIRNNVDPLFGGYTPEPMVRNIGPLMKKIIKSRADIGFAFDGDADTVGAVDSQGSFLQSYDIMSILLWHLVENRKLEGDVVSSFSSSQLLKQMAKGYGLSYHETPVGFSHITNLMLRHNILIGGEESGGIGVKLGIPDKNGPLVALLLLEAMVYSNKNISEIKSDIVDKFGLYCLHRTDIKFKNNDEKDEVISKFCAKMPSCFGDEKIKDVYTLDGIKCILEDDSWILFRPSGTEPVFRIYAESTSHEKSYKILNECESFIKKIL